MIAEQFEINWYNKVNIKTRMHWKYVGDKLIISYSIIIYDRHVQSQNHC